MQAQSMSKHMDSKTRDITLALAAIFQASYLVKQWAREGQTDDQAFEALLKSLLELNPQNINAVYGDIAHLKLGLETLVMFFESGSRARDKDIASYFVSLIVTQRKLQKNPAMLQKIQERIPFITTQVEHFGLTHANVLANIADIYSSTVSQLKYRIHVQGERTYLEPEAGITKIRVILMAGIRAAILWQQVGGRFYQFFLFRRRYVRMALQLLKQIETEANDHE